jgi:hypothetical protein
MTFRYRTLYQLSYNGPTYSLAHNAAGRELFVKNNRARPALCAQKLKQNSGGQGRIRTFVPRKEGQIYSLLALTTHPPVQKSSVSGER